ncbi:hypothetical protein CH63R_08221 [Colletotrichum higginsianum IMI 349063]|uniref:Uncharacterized protein n=3 Tax=Colletotrichum higginsianum TaxID=80884 RepID=A0A1B7YBK3_COLHI|nr:hypothetical protein CH63R_08221 [Colletotrichum higginsianum IMI 349063]OBR09456.1 hypothetical protein CH63R_08221 [Colletotrichum higginsianum IMI 349063]TIC95080.1 hypothetical protein CH35J_007950 [Colletotrichum higginsianum]
MPPQTRSGGRARVAPPPDRVYKSTKPAKQATFPHRRTEVRTYSARKPTARISDHQQRTLTQMFETTRSSPVRFDLSDDEEDPVPRKKRRKTAGDSPTPSSSFHTQTLTQMSRRSLEKSSGDEEEDDVWQFQPSDDEIEKHAPVLPSAKDKENQVPGKKALSRTPSVIPQTPTNKRVILEIPSSQGSPLTPMLARYSPAPKRSPLKNKSTNTMSPLPKLTGSVKRPRTLTVQDSYATTGSQASSQLTSPSKMPLQPAKNVRFITPHPTASLVPMEEDEEEETEGEEQEGRDVSPSPRRPARSPLREIADSEDELDDLEILDEEAEGYDAVGEETQVQMDQLLASSEEKQASKEASPAEEDDSDKENVTPAASDEDDEEATVVLSKPFAFPKLARLDSGASGRRETVEVITSSPEPTHNSGSSVIGEASGETNDESVSQTPTQGQKTPKSKGKASVETPKTPHTQGLESQRLPQDVVDGMGPQGDRTDIFISIRPEHMENIVAGRKNYEFRNYKIPHTVSRMWLYVTQPVGELRYMACFSDAKTPGEIDEDGIGNAEFNQKKGSKFAYRLDRLYELNDPLSLQYMMDRDYLHGPPQKYNYVLPAVVGHLMANLRCSVFGDDEDEDEEDRAETEAKPEPETGRKGSLPAASGPSQDRTMSQELAEQIRSDIERSTQHHSSDADLLVPSSQTPTRSRRKFGTELHLTKPTLPPTPFSRPPNPTPRRAVRPSQATTVSHASSSPSQMRFESVPRPTHADSSLPIFVDDEDDSPIRLPSGTFQLDSSQLLSKSQMLPESLLLENRGDEDEEEIVFDSEQDDDL